MQGSGFRVQGSKGYRAYFVVVEVVALDEGHEPRGALECRAQAAFRAWINQGLSLASPMLFFQARKQLQRSAKAAGAPRFMGKAIDSKPSFCCLRGGFVLW